MDASMSGQTAETRQAIGQLAKWWWAWLVIGILWIAASVLILQFNRGSVATVGIVIGIMFLAAAVEDFVLTYFTQSGWKWMWLAFGVLLAIGGIWALFNPVATVVAVADILGFVFVMIGVIWTLQAFATKDGNDLWWLGLVAGIMMLIMGFWASGQLLFTQAYVLLVFAGVWALLQGITDIIKAFQIKKLGATVMG